MKNFSDIKKTFLEVGWVKVPQFFDKNTILDIHNELDVFIEEIAPNLEEGDIHYSGKDINTIHTLSQNSIFFNDLLNNTRTVELMEYILEDKITPQWVQYFAKPALVGKAAPMHQDNYYWCVKDCKTVTMWIALDKVNQDNGGVSYYDFSHQNGILEHVPSYAKGTSQMVAETALEELPKNSLKIPILEPGDILLHHGNMVHGSEDNTTNKKRRGMSMWYKGSSAEVDEIALKKYQDSLKNQLDTIYSEKS